MSILREEPKNVVVCRRSMEVAAVAVQGVVGVETDVTRMMSRLQNIHGYNH